MTAVLELSLQFSEAGVRTGYLACAHMHMCSPTLTLSMHTHIITHITHTHSHSNTMLDVLAVSLLYKFNPDT